MKFFGSCSKTKKTEKLWHKHFIEVSVHTYIKYILKQICDICFQTVMGCC